MKPLFNIPLNQKPYFNTDSIANSIASDDMFDCYLEPVPGIGLITRRRPGLVDFTDLGVGQPGDGLFYWEAANKVIGVSGGRIFAIAQSGAVSEVLGTTLMTGVPVTFADGQKIDGSPWLYMANGKLVYTTDAITAALPTDTNTPLATHVAWINSRFLANEPGTNRFDFTDTNPATGLVENDYWSSTDNPVTCEAKGDLLSALFTAWQEVYAWGSEGLQIFQDDGVTPFAPIQSAFTEGGIEAVYSFVKADNTVFALCVIDDKRVVIKLQGRTPQVVSEPIASILASMDTVSDAIGDLVMVGGIAIYLLSFPSANQTWAYDYKNDTWMRWGYYLMGQGNYDRFIGQHSCFVKPWNKHLIMSRLDSRIYEMSRKVYNDAGNPMVSYRRSGWIDHGNVWRRKRINQFYIKGKTYPDDGTTNPVMQLRWRDNGNQVWSNMMDLPLNPDYQGDFLIKCNRFGMYRRRQYEFKLSDNVDMVLIGATEDPEVLRN
jgi:hypothetical protein